MYRNGYHGDTFGAMSVCDPDNGMHSMFRDILPKHFFASSPSSSTSLPDKKAESRSLSEIEETLMANHRNIAAIILEPIVQGAGGMKFYSFDFLQNVRFLCDKYDVLLILDEIATGFGRTGNLFACLNDNEQVEPDILCLGKALSAGYITSGATLASEKVCNGISEKPHKNTGSFMHGPTFMGNPLSSALSLASVNLLMNSPWQTRVTLVHDIFSRRLLSLKDNFPDVVSNVRVKGAIGVVEMKQPLYEYISARSVTNLLVECGVWLRPFGTLLYSMPPFNAPVSSTELNQICDAIECILRTVNKTQTKIS